MSTARAQIVIDADSSNAEKGVASIDKNIQKFGKSVGKVGKGLTKYITLPLIALGGALLAGANKTADYADEIDKMSIRTGMATDTLQELKFATDQVGVEFGAVESAVVRMTRTMFGAEEGTERQADAFKELEVSITDGNDEMRRAEDVFNDTIRSLQGMENETRRNAIAQEIFGRGAAELIPMLEAGEGAMDEMAQAARDLGLVMDKDSLDAAVAYKDEMSALKQEFGAAFREIMMNFIPMLREDIIPLIRDQVVPRIKEFSKWVADLVQKFKGLAPEGKKLAGMIGLIALVLGPVLVVIGKIITIIGILGIKFIIIAAIIGLVVTAIVKLWKENEGFRNRILDLWETIKQKALEVWSSIAAFWEEHGWAIIATALSIWQGVRETFEALWSALKDIWGSIKDTALALWEEISQHWEKDGDSITDIMYRLLEVIGIVWDWIFDTITTAINLIADIIGFVMAIIRGDWSEAWERIKSIVSSVLLWLGRTVKAQLDAVAAMFGTSLAEILKGIGKWISGVKARFTEIMGWIRAIPRQAVSWGRNIIDAIARGIRNGINNIKKAVTNITSTIRNFLPFSPAKEGPLKDLNKLDFGGPIFDSMTKAMPEIQNKMRDMLNLNMPDMQMATPGGATFSSHRDIRVEVPLYLDSREIARTTAPFTDEELHKLQNNRGRARGGR